VLGNCLLEANFFKDLDKGCKRKGVGEFQLTSDCVR